MTRISQRVALLCATGFLAALLACGLSAGAQDKEKKVDKKEEKKTNGKDKKEEKKTDDKGKKEEKKEEKKKEEYKPDLAQLEFKGHKDWIYVVAYGAGGKTLASASRDRSVKVWDLATKKEVQTFSFPGEGKKGDERRDNIKAIVLAQDRIFAGGGKFNQKAKAWQGEVKIWDAKAGGTELKSLKGHSAEINGLAVDKEGKLLYSGSADDTVVVWDVDAGKELNTIKAHTEPVMAIALSKDGGTLATASADGSVKLWDKSGKELAVFKIEKEVKTIDPKTKKEKVAKEAGRAFTCVAFSPDGKRLAGGNIDGFVKIWDVAEKKELQELKDLEGIWALAYSPDGARLATGGFGGLIKIWDAAGKELRTIKAGLTSKDTITTLAFSPDGTQLASGSLDTLIKIWDIGAAKK
jgi:WD40 repeat protein